MTEAEKVVAHVRKTIRNLNIPLPQGEYQYAHLALCVVDSVYSLGVRYESVERTVADCCGRLRWEQDRKKAIVEHSISEFLNILSPYENRWEALADEVFRNRQRTSTRSGILKAEAVYRFAKTLQQFRIETFAHALNFTQRDSLRRAITSIRGQGSGLSFNYFLILAGDTSAVKVDRMVTRFVADALGVRTVSPEACERLIRDAVSILRPEFPRLTPSLLDHAIWNYQRHQEESKDLHCSRAAAS